MTRFAGLALALAVMLLSPGVQAQGLQLQLGLSDGMILGVMARNGYTDIRITKKKLTKAQAEGCRGGKRYKVEMNLEGQIKKYKEIGTCRTRISPQTARNILRRQGYRQIRVRGEGNQFSAVACRGDRRVRLVMNLFGDIEHERTLGRCGGALSEHDVAAILRARGFSRIQVRQIRQGNYGAEACRGNDKMGLVVNRAGAIVRQQRIGRCDPPIHPATIPTRLAQLGFSRIEVVDRRLPRYLAHACRGNARLEVAMNRFGEIMNERGIGRCDPPLTGAMLEQRLQDAGYMRVRIVAQRANGFTADVCEDGVRLRLELTIFGETIGRQDINGRCPTPPIGDIVRDFERQGIEDAGLFIEGCRRGRRVRIELDRAGNEVDRREFGRCR